MVSGGTCRDNADQYLIIVDFALAMDHYQHAAYCFPQGNPALFCFVVFLIIDRQGQRVTEDQGLLLKADTMLASVADRLLGGPTQGRTDLFSGLLGLHQRPLRMFAYQR